MRAVYGCGEFGRASRDAEAIFRIRITLITVEPNRWNYHEMMSRLRGNITDADDQGDRDCAECLRARRDMWVEVWTRAEFNGSNLEAMRVAAASVAQEVCDGLVALGTKYLKLHKATEKMVRVAAEAVDMTEPPTDPDTICPRCGDPEDECGHLVPRRPSIAGVPYAPDDI